MSIENQIHGGELDTFEVEAEYTRFDSYYRMTGEINRNADNIELLERLYPSIPSSYRAELLLKCAERDTMGKCFAFLLDKQKPSLSESDVERVLATVMEHNCIAHLSNNFSAFDVSSYRLVNIAVVGVRNKSEQATAYLLQHAPSDVAASALTECLLRSMQSQNVNNMIGVVAPFCTAEHMPSVIGEVFSAFFTNPNPDYSLNTVEEFVSNLEAKTFKKVYMKIHTQVKENDLKVIRARHSKERLLSALPQVEAEPETTVVRRKM